MTTVLTKAQIPLEAADLLQAVECVAPKLKKSDALDLDTLTKASDALPATSPSRLLALELMMTILRAGDSTSEAVHGAKTALEPVKRKHVPARPKRVTTAKKPKPTSLERPVAPPAPQHPVTPWSHANEILDGWPPRWRPRYDSD